MKDIDFDELDRAVGSVLGADATNDTPAATTATLDAKPVDTPTPVAAPAPKVDEPSATSSTPAVSPAVSPARKRGQFLDMVHPSADMTKTPKMPSTVRKTVQPLDPSAASEFTVSKPAPITAPEPTPVAPETEAIPAPVPTTEPVLTDVSEPTAPVDETSHDNADTVAENTTEASPEGWPDPLDFAQESAEASSVSEEVATTNSVPTTEPFDQPIESAQTPFVADAKVDKRPLGAFADQDEETGAPVNETVAQPDTTDAPEFEADVTSVESTGLPSDTSSEEAAVGEQVNETGVASSETTSPELTPAATPAEPAIETSASASSTSQPSTESASPAAAAQAASIPQQYKSAEPAKTDEADHPLFDTEEYHQPLLPDGKKKSKKVVLIVVLLIILLVVGGALGYIAYTIGI